MIRSTVRADLICYANPQLTRGHSGGNWFAPNGTRVNNNNAVPGFGRYAGYGTVRLSRDASAGTPPEGIYRCEIDDNTFTTQTLYVGLYDSGGGKIMFFKKKHQQLHFRFQRYCCIDSGNIYISGGIVFTVGSDLNGPSPQFTLTCISTGGPATTVTWTRDSVTVTEGTETVLDDPVTAQYTHTLTMTGRLGRNYTCTVANNKPSNDSASYFVEFEGIIAMLYSQCVYTY